MIQFVGHAPRPLRKSSRIAIELVWNAGPNWLLSPLPEYARRYACRNTCEHRLRLDKSSTCDIQLLTSAMLGILQNMCPTAGRCARTATVLVALASWPMVAQTTPPNKVELNPAAGAAASGQDPSLRVRPKPRPQAAAPREVTLDVTVTDAHGTPVDRLSAADFTVTENGRPQKIDSFGAVKQGVPSGTGQPQPRTVLVFNEASDADSYADTQSQISAVLKKNNGMLAEPTELLEVVADKGLITLHGYTRDGHALLQALRARPSADNDNHFDRSGPTAWLQQIAEASQDPPGRKTIVWISSEDGEGMWSAPSCEPLQDHRDRSEAGSQYRLDLRQTDFMRRWSTLLLTGDITLDVLLHPVSAYVNEDPEGDDESSVEASVEASVFEAEFHPSYLSYLKSIQSVEPEYGSAIFVGCGLLPFAAESGGVMALDHGGGIGKDLEQSMTRAANFYTLTYNSSDGDIDGQFRQVHVSVDRPQVTVYARNGFYAMPNPKPPIKDRLDDEKLSLAFGNPVPYSGVKIVNAVAEFSPERTAGRVGVAQVYVYLDRRSLAWTAQPDGSLQCRLDLIAEARPKFRISDTDFPKTSINNLPVSHAIINLKEDQHSQNERDPIRVTIRLPITKSGSGLQVAVYDEQSGRLGTTEIHHLSQSTGHSVP